MTNEGYIIGLKKALKKINEMVAINEGWSGFYPYDDSRKGLIEEISERFYTWDTNESKGEVLRATIVGNAYYCVFRRTIKSTGEQFTMVGVAMISRQKGEVLVKDMTENEGPVVYKCPVTYFKMAGEPLTDTAAKWREMCGEQKNLGVSGYDKLSKGDTIILKGCTLGGKDKVYFVSWHNWKRKPYMYITLEPNGVDYSVRLPKTKIKDIIKAHE